MARSAESKNKRMPSTKNTPPKAVSPMPISGAAGECTGETRHKDRDGLQTRPRVQRRGARAAPWATHFFYRPAAWLRAAEAARRRGGEGRASAALSRARASAQRTCGVSSCGDAQADAMEHRTRAHSGRTARGAVAATHLRTRAAQRRLLKTGRARSGLRAGERAAARKTQLRLRETRFATWQRRRRRVKSAVPRPTAGHRHFRRSPARAVAAAFRPSASRVACL